jgi:hypothetical protein
MKFRLQEGAATGIRMDISKAFDRFSHDDLTIKSIYLKSAGNIPQLHTQTSMNFTFFYFLKGKSHSSFSYELRFS